MNMNMLLTIGVPVAILIIEWYLGRTDKVEANSTISLFGNILKLITGRK